MKNLESAKKQIKDNAAINGVDLPDDGFIMKMLELAATDNNEYLTDITHRNYEATKRRGLITSETTFFDFVGKIKEERNELIHSFDVHYHGFDPSELADIALVCFAMAEHYGIDLIEEMRKKTEFNEKRL